MLLTTFHIDLSLSLSLFSTALSNSASSDRTQWWSSNAPDLCSGGSRFESLSGCRISLLMYFVVLLNLLSSVALRPVFRPWPPRSPSSSLLCSMLPPFNFVSRITLQHPSFSICDFPQTCFLRNVLSLLCAQPTVLSSGITMLEAPLDCTACRSPHSM